MHGVDAVSLIRQGAFADKPLAKLAATKRGGEMPTYEKLMTMLWCAKWPSSMHKTQCFTVKIWRRAI